MRTIRLLVTLALLAVLAAACGDTGDRAGDEVSAQSLMPNIVGYRVTETDSIIDAVTAAGAGGALASGNVPLAVTIERAENILGCLQERGAVGAQVYIEENPADVIPQTGAVIIVNQTRLNRNLLDCIATGSTEGFRSQAVTIEPCADSGSFRYQENDFSYIYVGVGDQLCGFFQQHFTSIQAEAGGR